MILIVGLGNFENKYKLNRHNIGFMAVDYIAKELNFNDFSTKFKAEISLSIINNMKVLLLKPHTFMNLSGESIIEAINFFKISINNIIVLHDDIYTNKGLLKYKFNSGHGGHNGIKDIQNKIGNKFHRIKIGVGQPEPFMNISSYVLSNFSKDELNSWIPNTLKKIVHNFNYILNQDFETFVKLSNINN